MNGSNSSQKARMSNERQANGGGVTRRRAAQWAMASPTLIYALAGCAATTEGDRDGGFETGAAKTTPIDRLSFQKFFQDESFVRSLIKGVREMQARDPSEPDSWFFQGAVHGVTDDAIAEAERKDPRIRQVDQRRFWRQCPHNQARGDTSADFLVWHRAYLFYFERILRKASGNPQLSLPYWDYTDSAHAALPEVFRMSRDPFDRTLSNPLYDSRRNSDVNDSGRAVSSSARSTSRAFLANNFFGALARRAGRAATYFGGVPQSVTLPNGRRRSPAGLMEQRPHGTIHGAIGDRRPRQVRVDGRTVTVNASVGMATVPEAAFDPIFWLHHCNIDRLWCEWEYDANRRWGPMPAQSWFLQKPWSFYDANGSIASESRLWYLDRRNLAYEYETDRNRREKPLVERTPIIISSPETATSDTRPPTQQLEAAPVAAALTGISVPGNGVAGVARLVQSSDETGVPAVTARELEDKALLIEFNGIEQAGDTPSGFEVYVGVGLVQENLTSDHPSYAGEIMVFGLHHEGHNEASAVVDASDAYLRQGLSPSDIEVAVVAVPLLEDAQQDSERGISIAAISAVTIATSDD